MANRGSVAPVEVLVAVEVLVTVVVVVEVLVVTPGGPPSVSPTIRP
jgi:hypothetical protein